MIEYGILNCQRPYDIIKAAKMLFESGYLDKDTYKTVYLLTYGEEKAKYHHFVFGIANLIDEKTFIELVDKSSSDKSIDEPIENNPILLFCELTSGYQGTGPRLLAEILDYFNKQNMKIVEAKVDRNVIDKISNGTVSLDDLIKTIKDNISADNSWKSYLSNS